MSLSRQIDPVAAPDMSPITGDSEYWPPADGLEKHAHHRHQILYASRGVAHIETAEGSWILPPTRAVWISGGEEHSFRARRSVDVTILYVRPGTASVPKWSGCLVINVTPLVRELILACAKLPLPYTIDSPSGHLAQVLLEQLAIASQAPVGLPEPWDSRARRVAELLRKDPAERRNLADLARLAGASSRTIQRLFAAETGMSFDAWRLRHRMVVALELLADGESVNNVAFAVGYESPSSFIAAFRAMFSTTPARYYGSASPLAPHHRNPTSSLRVGQPRPALSI